MTESELYATLCHPLPPRNYRAAHSRAVFYRMFIVCAVLATIGGALFAFNN